jgi:hypothetical protein
VRAFPGRLALRAGIVGSCGLILILGTPTSAGAALAPATSTLTYLYGVSCTSRTSCVAAGYSDTAPPTTTTLAERWNGGKWRIQHTPRSRGSLEVYGLSCSSAKACFAVGYSEAPGTAALAERWNGGKWAIKRVPNPHRSYGSILYGVSCTAAAACTAVGISGSPSAGQSHTSLAERWNGTKWMTQHTPNRSVPAGGTYLSGVSCASRTACTAVGFVGDEEIPEGDVPLAMAWDGSKWAIQSTPIPPSTNNTNLNSVSCVSRNACTAVGYAANSSGVGAITLAERWNGANWVIQPTPNPTGLGDQATLNGVSCASRTACTAVGDYYDPVSGATASLAETWNGTSWTIQPTLNPGTVSYLYGVSCSSATACTAVGLSFEGAVTGWTSLAERWNGATWSVQHTPNP